VTCIDINHGNVKVNNSFCNLTVRPEQEESSGMNLCDMGWRTGTWSTVKASLRCNVNAKIVCFM